MASSVFFYHSDHLGSTSYVTDGDGNATQFVAYTPFGEPLVDEHAVSYESPYKFNGKEMDAETGLYYYGARYYDPSLALWYGVDALAEKYPSLGGYVYCAGNPIAFVDPDGNAIGWPKNIKIGLSFSLSTGIIGFGLKQLNVTRYFQGAVEQGIAIDLSYNVSSRQLTIGVSHTKTTYTDDAWGGGVAVYASKETKQMNQQSEARVGYDFDNKEFVLDSKSTKDNVSHDVSNASVLILNAKEVDRDFKEASIATDAHVDALFVGAKLEAGIYCE